MASLCFLAAASLKPSDAIHADDLGRYKARMDTMQDSHAIDMYMEDQVVIVDFYHGKTDTFESSASFKASDLAPAYFAQLDEEARQVFGSDYDSQSQNQRRAGNCGPNINKRPTESEGIFDLEARDSRCNHFCGGGGDCTDPACPGCRYTGGSCD